MMNDETSDRPKRHQRRSRRKFLLWIVIGLAGLCLAGAGLSVLSNQSLPDRIESSDRL